MRIYTDFINLMQLPFDMVSTIHMSIALKNIYQIEEVDFVFFISLKARNYIFWTSERCDKFGLHAVITFLFAHK